jgi:thiazole tautomerase (transcriptional regulator TenI)
VIAFPRLHLISNRNVCPIAKFPSVAGSAVAGGVGAIHLREPDLGNAELQDLVARTRRTIRSRRAVLLINGNVELAMNAEIDGVHLPERMLNSIRDVRSTLCTDSLIGVSIHSVESAVAAAQLEPDYLIAGHVFETGSKPDTEGRGLAFIKSVVSNVDLPVIAIGGITPENTASVIRAGAHGVAVMTGILLADDPELESRRYVEAIQDGTQ